MQFLSWFKIVFLLIVLSGCQKQESPSQDEENPSSALSSSDSSTSENPLSDETVSTENSEEKAEEQIEDQGLNDQNYIQATKYFQEGKLFKPAGQNAVEYFILARQKFETPQKSIENALQDLQPYLILEIESSLQRNDQENGRRLLNILKVIDPTAPSISRLEQLLSSPTPQQPIGNPEDPQVEGQ